VLWNDHALALSSDEVKADPRPVWKIWDEFKIEDSEMIGFWEDESPVTTNQSDVKVSVYKKDARSLFSIGNFSDSSQSVLLKIDFDKLGLKRESARLVAPEIEDFQEEKEWKPGDEIRVEARKGWLIYIGN